MKTIIAIIATVIALISGGCFLVKISEQDLIGKYQVKLPDGGIEYLELFQDGTCSQEIRLSNGEIYNAKGTWRFSNKRQSIAFRGIRSAGTATGKLATDLADQPKKGISVPSVSRDLFGNVQISFYEWVYYKKI